MVLEICKYGSLSDVIRGINWQPPKPVNTTRYTLTNADGGGYARSSTGTMSSIQSNNTYASILNQGNAGGGPNTIRPPLNLTISDKYFLALGTNDTITDTRIRSSRINAYYIHSLAYSTVCYLVSEYRMCERIASIA